VNAKEFKKWLAARGCTFETKKGGSGHLIVKRDGRKSELPMHGRGRELGTRGEEGRQARPGLNTGLVNAIKKQLGLK
jgi:mRNA interferase HicA